MRRRFQVPDVGKGEECRAPVGCTSFEDPRTKLYGCKSARNTVNTVPVCNPLERLRTRIEPRCFCTISGLTQSPRPVPVVPLVVTRFEDACHQIGRNAMAGIGHGDLYAMTSISDRGALRAHNDASARERCVQVVSVTGVSRGVTRSDRQTSRNVTSGQSP